MVIDRSAVLPTAVVALALLLVVSGSNAAGAETVAVFVMVPVAEPLTVLVTLKVAAAPEFRLTVVLMFPVPELAPQAFGGGVPTLVVMVHVQETDPKVAGKVSVTEAPATRSGPPFVTTIV